MIGVSPNPRLVPLFLALALTAAAVPGLLANTGPSVEADAAPEGPPLAWMDDAAEESGMALDGDRWHWQQMSGSTPIMFTDEDYEGAVAAAEQGMAYDIVIDEPVNLSAGEVVIQPGRMLIARNDNRDSWKPCSVGFIQDGRGSLDQFVTAGHCVNGAEKVVVPSRYNPEHVIAAGDVVDEEDTDAGWQMKKTGDQWTDEDWAVVDILPVWQDKGHVNPSLVGGAGPFVSDSEPMVQHDPDSNYTGTLTPWPLYYVGQPRPFIKKPAQMVADINPEWASVVSADTPVPGVGVAVETVGHWLVCECPFVPGNSGGPVVGPRGEAIGIISEWALRTVAQAVPPDDALPNPYVLRDNPERELDDYARDWKGNSSIGKVMLVSDIPGSVTTVDRPQQAVWGAVGCDPSYEPCPSVPSWCDVLLMQIHIMDPGFDPCSPRSWVCEEIEEIGVPDPRGNIVECPQTSFPTASSTEEGLLRGRRERLGAGGAGMMRIVAGAGNRRLMKDRTHEDVAAHARPDAQEASPPGRQKR